MACASALGRALLLGGLCASAALAGCGGGSTGPVGPVGPPGPVPPIVVGEDEPLPGVNIVVTSVSGGSGPGGSFHSGDFVTVRFTVRTSLGFDLDVPSMEHGDAYLSGPSFNYQRVLAGNEDLPSAAAYDGAGVWSYTFPTPIPAFYLPPFNDSASFGAGDGELAGQPLLDGTYTVGLELHLTYTVSGADYPDAGVATADLLFGAAVSIEHREVVANANCNSCHTELRCHDGTRKDVRLCVLCHTSGAEDDNTAGATPGVTTDFRVMIHKIHDGSHLPSVLGVSTAADGSRLYPGMIGAVAPQPLEYQGEPGEIAEFSEVNFPVWPNLNVAMPRDAGYSTLSTTDPDGAGPLRAPRSADDAIRTGVTACAKCHGDPDGAGPAGPPSQGDLFKLQPSRRACGSCHDDVDFAKPYTSNLSTMPPQPDDSGCAVCHTEIGSLPVEAVHRHPLKDPAVNAGVNVAITTVTGGTGPGGNFQVGDSPTVAFTVKDDTGASIGLATMDAGSAFFLGPTTNRQLVMPLTSPNGQTVSPFDFAGRLHATSSTGKGSMSKVFVDTSPVSTGTLVVEFTSATAFTVAGTVSGPFGAGALPAATSTNQPAPPPAGTPNPNPSISAFDLGAGLAAGGYTVVFSSPTAFTVSGPSGTIGTGTLPAATNSSMRFSSPDLSFLLSQGANPMTVFPHTINLGAFVSTGSVNLKFLVVAGRTAFGATAGARDRFYYEVVPPAPLYTIKLPMDMVLEFVGTGSGSAGQTLTPGNTPAYYGRQQLWEAATTATTTTTLAGVAAMDRRVDVAPVIGFANGDTVVVEPLGAVGVREYVQIAPARADGVIAAAADSTTRLWFKTPLRYAHALGVSITKVTLTFKQEGATNAYTFPTNGSGLVTSVSPFTTGAGLLMSYRTDARFGYRRHPGDAVQATYVPPANDSTDIGQDQGDWHGLPYQDGTYTADLWLARNADLGLQNEVQTYRCTSNSAQGDFLFGGAAAIVPHEIVSATSTCLTCHDDLIFHGGGRRGLDTCLTCHSVSGSEDKPRWDTPKVGTTTADTALTPGVAIEFRQMLHKIHRGSGLAFAATYTVVGNSGNPSTYGEVEFPAMPGDVRQCVRCHGNNSWKEPAPRFHALASVSVRVWGGVCGSCHDSDAAHAHIDTNTVGGLETCDVCHGPGRPKAVEMVHLPR